jgi:DNA recombination protein RmuC
MSVILILLAAVVAALVAWGLAAWMQGRSESQLAALRQELQNLVSGQVQTINNQLGQLTHSVNQQLGQVTSSLQQGLTDSGMLVSKAQEAVKGELKNSLEMLGRINMQLGEVIQAGRELSKTQQELQMVLGGAKSRGTLGETALEGLLEDALPVTAYQTQFRFATGSIVDAIVHSGERLLSIDSKFPLDAYRRLMDGGEDARREFSQAVRKHADSIAEKYILPDEQTLDFALMFVPSEGIYYELLMTEDSKSGRLDEYCRCKKVFPVSPNTCYAYLIAINTSLRGLKVEENARRLLGSLAGLERQIDSFAEVYEKLGNHLRHSQQSYEDASSKLERARNSLEQLSQGAPPDAAPKVLEPAATE